MKMIDAVKMHVMKIIKAEVSISVVIKSFVSSNGDETLPSLQINKSYLVR